MSNIHGDLPTGLTDEGNQFVHNPRGFDAASAGEEPWKNENGVWEFKQAGSFPPALDFVSAEVAPPTEVTGDIYVIDSVTDLDIDTITWQSSTTVRIAFNGSPSLSAFAANDWFTTSGNGNSSNDGTFLITTVDTGSFYIEVTNIDRTDGTDDESSDAVGTGYITLAEWDSLARGNSWLKFNGTSWIAATPQEGTNCWDKALESYKVFNGSAWVLETASGTQYDSAFIPASSFFVNGGTFNSVVFTASATSSFYNSRWQTQGHSNSSDEVLQATYKLPFDYKDGTDIEVTFDFISGTGAGNVYWHLGLTQETTVNILGGESETEYINNTESGTAFSQEVIHTTATFSGTNLVAGDNICIIVGRESSHAKDTLAEAVYGVGISIKHEKA